MKRLLPYLSFACFIAVSATSNLPVTAGGCSSSRNKSAEIICDNDDTECQTKKTKNFELKEAIKS